MRGLPIVTPKQMKQLEKTAFDAGEDEQLYMENAGLGIAKIIESYLITPDGSGEVYLLIGKGNNGGDAFVVGEYLRKKEYPVTAFHLYPISECSKLSQKMAKRFEKAGGKLTEIYKAPTFEKGIIIDGLVGTGFKGPCEGLLADTIEASNASGLPLYAIDIPSGLNGETGEVKGCGIKACTTIYLGLPKLGFYLNEGLNYVGELLGVDFGMDEKFTGDLVPSAYLVSEEMAANSLPEIERTRHKYQAGYVLAVAGSCGMSGAAIMSCLSALKSGAGIVRLFYPHEMKDELASAPYELITEGWDLKDDTRLLEESKRGKALLFGPGVGRSKQMHTAMKMILEKTKLPTVIDADGLFLLAEDSEMPLPEETILTPHYEEMKRLLKAEPTLDSCQAYVNEKKCTLVLKGAPTMIFCPHLEPLVVPFGDPGMATAGTGDVLTGIIAALLAQGLNTRDAACLGVVLHALAGEEAAESETSYGVIATDLIYHLPDAFGILQERRRV